MNIIIGFIKKLFPKLDIELKRAGITQEVDKYLHKSSIFAAIISILITLFMLLVFLKERFNLLFLIPIFAVLYFLFLFIIVSMPKSRIRRRRTEAESDILYSARFLLLKLESGSPLLNALVDTSNLKTKSSKFFNEIVTEVYLGTPIEEAIDKAIKYGVSPALSKILEEIKTSLKTGADIEKSLKATLDDLTKEHVIQIKAYGKKLSPISMFYMIGGTILPSIGSALLVIASGFLPGFIEQIDWKILGALAISILAVQLFFILLFKSVKPTVMT